MKRLLLISGILLSILTGCHREEPTVTKKALPQKEKSVFKIFDALESQSVKIYAVSEIEKHMIDMYGKEFPTLREIGQAKIDTIFSADFLPYMERFYVNVASESEVAKWQDNSIKVPNVFMYIFNLPDSGYVLAFADAQFANPLLEFSSSGSWCKEKIIDDIDGKTDVLIRHLPSISQGSTGVGLADDPLFNHNDANTIYGEIFDEYYNYIDPIKGLTTLYMQVITAFRMKITSAGSFVSEGIINYDPLKNWTQDFKEPGCILDEDDNPICKSGTIPLSVSKTLFINKYKGVYKGKQYDFSIPQSFNQDLNLLYDLSTGIMQNSKNVYLHAHNAQVLLGLLGYSILSKPGDISNYSYFHSCIQNQQALTYSYLCDWYNLYRVSRHSCDDYTFYFDCNTKGKTVVTSALPYLLGDQFDYGIMYIIE